MYLVAQSYLTLCDHMDCSPSGSSSMGFSRQEYWSGLPFPSPGDLLDPGIEFTSPVSPALAGRFLPLAPSGKPGGSDGKESTCTAGDAGDLGSIPGSGRSPGGGHGFRGSSEGKESTCDAGDMGLIPRSRRSPGGGNGNPLWYSCLGNPMDRGAWWATVHGVAKSWT